VNLYEKALGVSKPYLGPAAENFIARQCKSHLKIEPSLLAPQHLPELAKWMAIGGALIMDGAKAAELSKKIAALK
jgi:hypothetical protein